MTFKLASLPRSAWALFFAYACMVALGLADNIRGPLFPELIDFFKVSNGTGSLSFAFSSGAAFVGTFLSVYLLKIIHPDKLLIFAILLMSFGLLGMGASDHFVWYLTASTLFGLSMGWTQVAQNLLITENIDSRMRTKALSGLHALYGFASLIAPYMAAHAANWFHNSRFSFLADWRSAFYLTGSLSFVLLLVVSVIGSEPGFDYAHPEPLAADVNAKNKKAMQMIGIFFAGYVAAEVLVTSRLALYLRSYFNMNLEDSSNYVTYFFIFMLAGRSFFIFKNLNFKLRSQLNFSLAATLLFLILGLYIHPFFLALTGLSMAPFYPLAIVYIAEITGAHQRKYLTFAIIMQSLLVIAMHVGVGYLTDWFGLFAAFGTGIFFIGISLYCLNKHPKVVV
jgi:fucose permease